jgi:hypothetical protein
MRSRTKKGPSSNSTNKPNNGWDLEKKKVLNLIRRVSCLIVSVACVSFFYYFIFCLREPLAIKKENIVNVPHFCVDWCDIRVIFI